MKDRDRMPDISKDVERALKSADDLRRTITESREYRASVDKEVTGLLRRTDETSAKLKKEQEALYREAQQLDKDYARLQEQNANIGKRLEGHFEHANDVIDELVEMGALSPDIAYANHPEKLRAYNAKRKVFGIISIIGLIGAIFFLSNNLTGNVIGNLTNSTMNIFGIIFAVVCIGGLFLFTKNKPRKIKKNRKK